MLRSFRTRYTLFQTSIKISYSVSYTLIKEEEEEEEEEITSVGFGTWRQQIETPQHALKMRKQSLCQ